MFKSRFAKRPSLWQETLLVCAKCSRKVDGGFGAKERTPLRKALRKALHLRKGRKATLGIVEVGCFGLCPREAVTVVRGSEPDALYVVPRGTPVDDVVTGLSLGPAPRNGSDEAGSD